MSFLYDRLKDIHTTNPYFSKDLEKAKKANKFIGQGSELSSTHKYATYAGELANCGKYDSTDIVFISAEGNRRNRKPINEEEILKAINAGVQFVTDNAYNRNRPYNLGEREVATLLENNGYQDKGSGIWKLK